MKLQEGRVTMVVPFGQQEPVVAWLDGKDGAVSCAEVIYIVLTGVVPIQRMPAMCLCHEERDGESQSDDDRCN
jgi:hypothetical protein